MHWTGARSTNDGAVFLARPRLGDVILVEDPPERSYAETAAEARAILTRLQWPYTNHSLFNRSVQHTVSPDRLNSTFAALADPTRRAILARLASGNASVTKLARPFDMSLPAISKHLKVLERAGLITRGREAQWRPCRLQTRPLKEAVDWLERYRRFWDQTFDRLDA